MSAPEPAGQPKVIVAGKRVFHAGLKFKQGHSAERLIKVLDSKHFDKCTEDAPKPEAKAKATTPPTNTQGASNSGQS